MSDRWSFHLRPYFSLLQILSSVICLVIHGLITWMYWSNRVLRIVLGWKVAVLWCLQYFISSIQPILRKNMDVNKQVRLFNFALNVKKQHFYYYSTAGSSMMNIAEAFTNGQSRSSHATLGGTYRTKANKPRAK